MNENFNIVDHFFEAVQRKPDQMAIISKNQQISFGELEQQVNETAAYFKDKGICKGHRVLVFVPMSIDLYRIVLALFRMGATAVFLDAWVSKKRMEECCKVASCKAFIGIFKARALSWFSAELRKIPIHLGLSFSPARSKATLAAFPFTTKSDTALITFTTGSTGTPKAAKRTHGFLEEQFKALMEKTELGEADIDMPVLPIVLLMNLGTGTPSIIADFKAGKPQSLHPAKIIAQLRQSAANRMTASPFFLKALSRFMIQQQISLPKIEKIFTGGAPVFPSEAALYQQAFPQAKIEVVYGSTESEPISAVNVRELIQGNKKLLSAGLKVGKPASCAEVKIIKITEENIELSHPEELSSMEMPQGEVGEIIVSGKHVLREYFNNEAALKRNKIFIGAQCWHRTGDSGYLDANDVLYLTGRCRNLIYLNGKLISPFIYEGFIQSLEGVELGTIMLLDKKLTAIIELNDRSKEEEVRRKIGELDVPVAEVIFLKKIPRDPRHHSKIEYGKLKV